MSVHDLTGRPAMRAVALAALAAAGACSPSPVPAGSPSMGTSAAITVDDLRSRLYAYAADSMMGRDAPSVYNDKATDYIAAEFRRIGLEPAGENGTYFQSVLATQTIDRASAITVNGQSFSANGDFLPRYQGPAARALDGAQVVHGGVWGSASTLIDPAQTPGKVVVITVPPLANGQPGWQANRGALTQRYPNAAAIVVASLDAMPAATRTDLSAPTPSLRGEGSPSDGQPLPQFLYATRAMAQAMLGGDPAAMQMGTAGRTVTGAVRFTETSTSGARNVIAILRGSDPALRNTYVAIGAHTDHVGFASQPLDHDSVRAYNTVVRPEGADQQSKVATEAEWPRIRAVLDSLRRIRPPRLDSIYNGADDDGSGTVAIIEIAEAMAAGPKPRRSILFVMHTAEEDGLLGAQYFSEHPTVPRDSIVSQINIDMIGRGAASDIAGGRPGYVQLIGSRRLSTELGNLVETLNGQRGASDKLTFDYQYDADGHPANYYCRSDHYHYARWGIPVVFFSSGGHRDYHQITDEPQYIQYPSLRMITQFIHDLGMNLANRATRPAVDKPKPDPYGACRQ